MKYKLKLLQPVRVKNDFGEESYTYTEIKIVWAERVKMNANTRTLVTEQFSNYHTEYNIRDVHTISENWRVQELGGNLYNVTNIIPNLDRGFKTLICEKVND